MTGCIKTKPRQMKLNCNRNILNKGYRGIQHVFFSAAYDVHLKDSELLPINILELYFFMRII